VKSPEYRILLVEDDELDRMAFKRFVAQESLPYDCTTAGSVSQARKALSRGSYDIVIADYSLGDGTAFDILAVVRDTPVILVTGAGDEETAVKAWKAGAYDYLVKDIDRKYLKTLPITIENAVKHKRATEQLQLLSGAVMSTDDSVYITDPNNRIIFVNRAFCETYGYTEAEITGKDTEILWADRCGDGNANDLPWAENDDVTLGVGFWHRRKDGSPLPVSLSRSTVRNAEGNEIATVAIARDISEQTRLEKRLRAANAKLRAGYHLLSKAVSILSRSLKDSLAAGRPEQAGAVIDDFITVIDAHTGKIELSKAPLQLGPLLDEVIESARTPAAEKNIELKVSASPGEVTLDADRRRIARALKNAIISAVASAQPNSQVEIRTRDTGSRVAIEIRYAGSPGQAEVMRTILKAGDWPDARLEGRDADVALALLAAKTIADAHAGRLWMHTPDDRLVLLCIALAKTGAARNARTTAPIAVGR